MDKIQVNSTANLELPSVRQFKIRRLTLALGLLGVLSCAEIMISQSSHSLSLLADAGHVVSDVGAIALTLLAVWFGPYFHSRQQRPTHQFETIVALMNGMSLFVIAAGVMMAAIARLHIEPVPYRCETPVLAAAISSLLINGCNALWLKSCSHNDLNLKSAFLHVLADMTGAFGVIAAAIAGLYFGCSHADEIASLIVSAIIVLASIPLVIQSIARLVNPALSQDCLCQPGKQELEKILFPSLEQLVL